MRTLAQAMSIAFSKAVRRGDCLVLSSKRRYPEIAWGGKKMSAHRAAYLFYHGELPPEGHDVCHTCDVTGCIAEAHLVGASHSWNMRDRDRKGRNGTLGEASPLSKLTKQKVLEIDRLVNGGVEFRTIAAQFGISPFTVKRIAERTTWKHLWTHRTLTQPTLNLAA